MLDLKGDDSGLDLGREGAGHHEFCDIEVGGASSAIFLHRLHNIFINSKLSTNPAADIA